VKGFLFYETCPIAHLVEHPDSKSGGSLVQVQLWERNPSQKCGGFFIGRPTDNSAGFIFLNMKRQTALLLLLGFLWSPYLLAQEPYVRIAKIIVDSSQLKEYQALLKEGIATSVKLEKGVLKMYAVYEKDKPNHVTVFETYASKSAYESHIKTTHFQQYKNSTQQMVRSLELIDVVPIIYESKKE
jgi:quinol monooxygenase YgiN